MMIKPRTQHRSQPIEKIRKKFRNKREYLLIAIDKMDEKTTTPLTGRLLAHSPFRDEIYKEASHHRGLSMIDYTGTLPPDTAIMF